MHTKIFNLAWGVLLVHPTTIFVRNLRQNSNTMQLCFDLSSTTYGQFGRQTIEVANVNSEWFLDHDEVSQGPCNMMESFEIINGREMKQVTYCKHIRTAKNGREYEIHAPHYLESYLHVKGAGRGGCMNAESSDMEPYTRHEQSAFDRDTVALCFDLNEYGKQTISVAK